MVQEDDYTFVTIDGDDMGISDAVVVDVNAEGGLLDAVTIDSDAVTVDGSEQNVELGGTVTLEDDVAFAIVTDQNGSSVNTSGSIRILGDTSIITSNNVIYTMPGASIRTGTPTGLRFQTVLHQGAIDALLAAGNVSDIRVGTLIALTLYGPGLQFFLPVANRLACAVGLPADDAY